MQHSIRLIWSAAASLHDAAFGFTVLRITKGKRRLPTCRRSPKQFISLMLLAVTALAVTVPAQKKPVAQRAPVLIRNTAAVVAQGMSIELDAFYPDGLPENATRVDFVFLQNGKRLLGKLAGGVGQLEARTYTYNVTAPEGLASGTCQVVMQLGKQQSQPIRLEIADSVPPPVVASDYAQVTPVPQDPPRPAQPGDVAYFEGANFSPSDEVEIVDALGVVHRVPANSSSSAGSSGFMVPENIADGEATFEIIEQRSGTRQRSNKVSLQILNVPLPLEIPLGGMRPVAPGQWLDISVEDIPPYGQPKQVEVAFEQNEKTTVIELRLEPNDELHMLVPHTLFPGDAVLRTRTRRDGRVSEWSQPVRYQLLEHPAAPSVQSAQRIRKNKPGRSEPLIHFEGDKSSVLIAEPGDRIAVWGHFGIESTSGLRVKLMSGTRHTVTKPTESDPPLPCYFEFELPRDLAPGDWQVHISEGVHDTSSRLMLTLRVRRGR